MSLFYKHFQINSVFSPKTPNLNQENKLISQLYKNPHQKNMEATKNKIHSQPETRMYMTTFSPITIQDKDLITSYIYHSESKDCELSFANLCSWHFMTESSFAIINHQLVIRFLHPEGFHEYFLPIGRENPLPAIKELEKQAAAENAPLIFRGILPELKDKLEAFYPHAFEYKSDRNYFDYIYKRQDLAELKGKNYQPKRNHVNKFRKAYEFNYVPLTAESVPECLQFEAEWCMKHGYIENENIRNEGRALTFALHHFETLGLTGAIIRTEGKLAAFTFGAPISQETFGVHYEKADIHIDGIYSAVNQLFAANLPEQYIYLNREEDLGIPGLRQAKLSYHPTILLEKARAIKK